MRKPKLRDWSGDTGGGSITTDATPPAESQLLQAAVDAVLDLATSPYVGTGHLFEGGTTGLEDRYFAVSLAPASKHVRVALTNAFGSAAPASYTSTPCDWWTTTGGTTGNDVCRVPTPNLGARGFPSSAVKFVQVALVVSSDYAKDNTASLTAPADRLGELAEHRAPTVEPMYCKHACGVAVAVCEQSSDLETCPA